MQPDAPIAVPDQPHLSYVLLHGHVACSIEQLRTINTTLETAGKQPLSGKAQRFRWAVRGERRFSRLELELYTDTDTTEGNILVIDLTVRGARAASRARRHEERLREVQVVLAAIAMQSLSASFSCIAVWHFPVEEAKLAGIQLPFDLPFGPPSGLRQVSGVKVRNPEATAWAVFDLAPDAKSLHVSTGFKHDIDLGEQMLSEAIQHGQLLLTPLLVYGRGDE